jgi:hypothetical protein
MKIHTNQPDAHIYVDGEYLGQGSAKIGVMGPPRTAQVRVVYNGHIEERSVHREFKASTAVIGLFTYLTGLYWAWQYPSYLTVNMPDGSSTRHRASGHVWTTGQHNDPWSQPMFHDSKSAPKDKETKGDSAPKKKSASEWGS